MSCQQFNIGGSNFPTASLNTSINDLSYTATVEGINTNDTFSFIDKILECETSLPSSFGNLTSSLFCEPTTPDKEASIFRSYSGKATLTLLQMCYPVYVDLS